MKKINCIVLDLDGTLLDKNNEISNRTLCVLKCLKKSGIKIILASGRHYRNIEKYADVLELDASDFIISCDGQYIHNGIGNLLHSNSYIKPDEVRKIENLLHLKKRYLIFSNNIDFVVCKNVLIRFLYRCFYCIRRNSYVRVIKSPKYINSKIEKIRIEMSKDIHYEGTENLLENYTIHRVLKKWIEITAKDTNKFNALIFLQKMEEINFEQIIYFGNDYNDEECFDGLPICVAMSNSPKEIKKKATYVTDANCIDEVADFLINYYNLTNVE